MIMVIELTHVIVIRDSVVYSIDSYQTEDATEANGKTPAENKFIEIVQNNSGGFSDEDLNNLLDDGYYELPGKGSSVCICSSSI